VIGTVMLPIIWGVLFAVLGWAFVRRRRMYAFMRENDDGIAMLASGELVAASEVFDRLCTRTRNLPALQSLFVYNRAVTFLESGDIDEALALMHAVLRAGWITPRGTLAVYYPSVVSRIALAEGLRGRLDQARSWQRRAHEVTSEAKRPALLLVDVIVAARSDDVANVVKLVEQGWERAENLMTTRQLRALRVFEAFALEQLSGAEYRVEYRDEDFKRSIEQAGKAGRGAFDYLAVAWPKLKEFLSRHGLDGRATPPR